MPNCTDKFSSFLNEVIKSLDRIDSGKSCQTLGATTPKALAPVAVSVLRSQIRLREAEGTAQLEANVCRTKAVIVYIFFNMPNNIFQQ